VRVAYTHLLTNDVPRLTAFCAELPGPPPALGSGECPERRHVRLAPTRGWRESASFVVRELTLSRLHRGGRGPATAPTGRGAACSRDLLQHMQWCRPSR
jgi:hypothetical protein